MSFVLDAVQQKIDAQEISDYWEELLPNFSKPLKTMASSAGNSALTKKTKRWLLLSRGLLFPPIRVWLWPCGCSRWSEHWWHALYWHPTWGTMWERTNNLCPSDRFHCSKVWWCLSAMERGPWAPLGRNESQCFDRGQSLAYHPCEASKWNGFTEERTTS